MSDKPKRTISDEQRKKMAEGRKKALEKRKLEKEQKRVDNEKELKKELAALKQQKDQMEAKLITKENRKKFREKMRSKSVAFDEEEEPEPVHSSLDVMETRLEPEPEPEPEDVEEDLIKHERIFKEKVKEISGKASTPEAKTFFKKLTSNYDNKVDITTNLRNMSSELKQLIAHNVEQIKTNNRVISEAKAEERQPEVVEQPTPIEVRTEAKYQSQLASLMRLR
jgi:hypothetical protein